MPAPVSVPLFPFPLRKVRFRQTLPRSCPMWNGHRKLFLFLIVVCSLATGGICAAQEADDEQREKAIAERFRTVLEGNPRRGTALDRFYGYHVERGSLDGLVAEYQKRTANDPKDGAAWMIMGLI